jgi:aminoglycoside phosphotransferase (APT) family kinase protein
MRYWNIWRPSASRAPRACAASTTRAASCSATYQAKSSSRRRRACPDARLVSAARLIRSFHDATVGTPLAGDEEVVRHGDLGSHNIVFDGDEAVALIDWDEDVGPGARLADFAHAVWCCADVCEDEVDVSAQGRRVRLMCDAYGWQDAGAVLDEITARFRRARDTHAAAAALRRWPFSKR